MTQLKSSWNMTQAAMLSLKFWNINENMASHSLSRSALIETSLDYTSSTSAVVISGISFVLFANAVIV